MPKLSMPGSTASNGMKLWHRMHFHMVVTSLRNVCSISVGNRSPVRYRLTAHPFLTSRETRQAVLTTCGFPHIPSNLEFSLQGKNLFLDRAISRTGEWQCRFPALAASGQEAGSISQGRQVVVATTSATRVRCIFFSSHGSVLDFSATWDELDHAKTWWHFVRRWNFWIVGSASEICALQCSDDTPVSGLSLDLAHSECGDNL